MATHRYSPYKIKPSGGSLISAHYLSLPEAIKAARRYVSTRVGEGDAIRVDIVARGSNVRLGTVDAQGRLHPADAKDLREVERKYGRDKSYWIDPQRGGPTVYQYFERLFAATKKLARNKRRGRVARSNGKHGRHGRFA